MESAPVAAPAAAAASSSPSVGPHVLVPISHPDSPVPTYAVLQFLGFSSPSSSVDIPSQSFVVSPNFALPHLQLICPSPPAAIAAGPSSAPPTPPTSLSLKPSESSSSSDGARDDGPPPPRERDREKKFVSLKPSPMKKAGACSGALSPRVKTARVGPPNSSTLASPLPVRTIAVSQTERETIVHTHSSNFREVVHQLTGASSDDKDLLPVTMPARTMGKTEATTGVKSGTATVEHNNAAAAAAMTTGRASLEPGAARRPVMKLLERRRSSKVLERLTTSCRELPPLVPSPVTPLASDFEKICLPVTPTTSQSSTSIVQSVSGPQDSNMVDAEQATGKPENEGEAAGDAEEQGKKGFFLPAHRPKSGPTLLHLFPESPRE